MQSIYMVIFIDRNRIRKTEAAKPVFEKNCSRVRAGALSIIESVRQKLYLVTGAESDFWL